MGAKVYVETSFFSYLTARASRDLVTAARQQLTREWWDNKREAYDLYISEFVVTEASRGDPTAAAKRLSALDGIPEIALADETASLATALLNQVPLPPKAAVDALHIAVAVTGGVDYLMTWNFKHLANATVRRSVEGACRFEGFEPCVICTPEELLEA